MRWGFIRSVPLKECCGWRLLCPLETIRGTRQTKPHRSFGGNHHRIGMSRGVQTTGGRPTIVPNIISHINCVLRFATRSIEPLRWYHHVWKQCLHHFDIIITQFVNDRSMMRKSKQWNKIMLAAAANQRPNNRVREKFLR